MPTHTVQNQHRLTPVETRTLFLASLGGVPEFYDFVIFVFFAAVIGELFFPRDLPNWVRQMQTFGIFAAQMSEYVSLR